MSRPRYDRAVGNDGSDEGLPEGWTIERIRTASGDSEAELLSLARLVVVEVHGRADHETLRPSIIISFHGLCLVKAGDDWYMGDLDSDGSISCWSSYGPDLGEAIRGL
ncbi:hypothetical protein ACFV4F_11885 [Kitasatospora sp. NPDC059722]|uniref:hypothetical protein n=1 Tax=unclassified Kitasatospora TaxID=2633591 RepID=UPI0036675874